MDALPDAKANHSLNTQQLFQELQDAKAQFGELSAVRELIMKKARFRAKMTMSLGLAALVGYFNFVALGTYYVWSWDVVEPLAYFLGLGGTIFVTSRFFKLQDDYENNTYFEYLALKHFKKLAPKYDFTEEEFEAARDNLNALRNKLKLSMLIDL
jgi:hypothetical protein